MKSKWYVEYNYKSFNRYTIICFSHAGSSSFMFASWLTLLPDDVNLIGVELPGHGLREVEPFIDNVKTVTANLISEFYFNKPYIIFGHSLGALIAYEFIKSINKNLLPKHFFISAQDTEFTEEHLHYNQNNEELLNNLKLYYQQMPDVILKDANLLHNFLNVLRADLKMLIDYQKEMEILPVPITAMYGEDDKLLDKADLMQWKNYTNTSFECMSFAGDHFYLNSATNKKLIIKAILDKLYNS